MPNVNRSYSETNRSTGNISHSHQNLSWGLYLYVILFAVLFLQLGVYIAFIFIKFKRRIMKHKPALLLAIFIEMTTLLESISLVSQPFLQHDRSHFIHRGYEPFMINSYCLLQIIFLRITRLDIKPIRFNGIKCVVCTTILLTVTQVVTDVLKKFTKIHLDGIDVNGICFVLYGLYLDLCFVVSAPKLGKYTRETRIARKDISIQSISKRIDSISENSSVHTSLRIKTPRIRYSGNMVKLITDPESSDSNNDVSQNKDKKRFSDSDIKLYLGASKTQRENRRRSAESERDRAADRSEKYKTSADWSSDSMDEYYSVNSFRESPYFSLRRKSANSTHLSKDDVSSQRKRSRGSSVEFSNTAINLDSTKNDCLGVAKLSFSDAHSFKSSENSSIISLRSDLNAIEARRKHFNQSTKPKKAVDSGYVADCELISVTSEANERRKSSPSQANESPFGMHLPYSTSFLSLYRLHQARILRDLLRITYALTTVVTVLCVFKVYLMFIDFTDSWMKPRQFDPLWYAFNATER